MRESLETVAIKVTDTKGIEISIESIEVGQKAYAVQNVGTGYTWTPLVRIL